MNVIASHGKMFLTVDNTFKKLDSRANEIESVTWGTILGDMMVFNPNTNKIYIAYEYLEKIHVIDTS